MKKFELLYHLLLTSPLQKYLYQQYINHLILKIIIISASYLNSSISIDRFYYGVYPNAQFELCTKRLCGH